MAKFQPKIQYKTVVDEKTETIDGMAKTGRRETQKMLERSMDTERDPKVRAVYDKAWKESKNII